MLMRSLKLIFNKFYYWHFLHNWVCSFLNEIQQYNYSSWCFKIYLVFNVLIYIQKRNNIKFNYVYKDSCSTYPIWIDYRSKTKQICLIKTVPRKWCQYWLGRVSNVLKIYHVNISMMSYVLLYIRSWFGGVCIAQLFRFFCIVLLCLVKGDYLPKS